MKYKTLFRLALKFLGVWLAVQGILGLVVSLGVAVVATLQLKRGQWDFYIAHILETFLQGAWPSVIYIAAGAYLFFRGEWIVDLAIPSNRRYCHECGYQLAEPVGAVCPECGVRLEGVGQSTSVDEGGDG